MHHVLHFGCLSVAAMLIISHAVRVSQMPGPWPSPNGPGFLWYMPMFAAVPMVLATAGTFSLSFRRGCTWPRTHGLLLFLRWVSITVALGSLALVAYSEIARWSWERRGSPTAMGNLEMLGPLVAYFYGWIGFAIAGGMEILVTATVACRGEATGHCRACDYDLRGTIAAGLTRCPECGCENMKIGTDRRVVKSMKW